MNEPERTITIVATLAGLRIGEILDLRWGRVHLDRVPLEVEETCYKGVFGTPKSKAKASRRGTPLAPVVVQALDAHRFRYINTSVDASPKVAANRSQPTTCGRNAWLLACRRAGLRRIDWHTLRHTYSTLLHDLGTPIKGSTILVGALQRGNNNGRPILRPLRVWTRKQGVCKRFNRMEW